MLRGDPPANPSGGADGEGLKPGRGVALKKVFQGAYPRLDNAVLGYYSTTSPLVDGHFARRSPDGAGSGVPRLRLVTAGSGGTGIRPPVTKNRPRGASLHGRRRQCRRRKRGPGAIINRHGGAPRGRARRSQRRAGRLRKVPRRAVSWHATGCRCTRAPLSALRSPFGEKEKERTRRPRAQFGGHAER